LNDELDATILGASCLTIIGCDRLALATPAHGEASGRYAETYELIAHGHRAL
jgi:hypothetical protein